MKTSNSFSIVWVYYEKRDIDLMERPASNEMQKGLLTAGTTGVLFGARTLKTNISRGLKITRSICEVGYWAGEVKNWIRQKEYW